MQQHLTRRATLVALTAAAASAFPGLSSAQADRPVKFILPNATGSGVDAITRAAAPALGKALGTNVVVENQAGASGVIGLQALAKNPPDGPLRGVTFAPYPTIAPMGFHFNNPVSGRVPPTFLRWSDGRRAQGTE